ncbi:NAD(P)-binding protein [Calocera cornea HHB12733]|uniref:NAD(P)-binding protein n=1 Tax=Calocera cornea HHB12733 TaxID=1353952 RepID=A0A165CEK9_9BASI|nr:NAD(P)-binding protein [Calocera cornea HHB12733]
MLTGQKELALVTGATGFIGTAVTLELIASGYRVLAVARSFAKVNAFLSRHPSVAGLLSWAIVPDMTVAQAFDTVISGVDYVVHVASPVNRSWKPFDIRAIDMAAQGTLNVLEAAAGETSVKRVVMTSTFGTLVNHSLNPRAGYTYTDKDWNPLGPQDVSSGGDPAYVVSKKLAEQAAWNFMESRRPQFTLTTFCPPLAFGPPIQPVDSMSHLNTSADEVWKLMNGSCHTVPPNVVPVWIDVRDVARMHVAALSNPLAANQRYITVAGVFTNSQIAHILRQAYPDLAAQGRIPPSDNDFPPEQYDADSSKALRDFDAHWVGFDQSVKDTAEELLKLEEQLHGVIGEK